MKVERWFVYLKIKNYGGIHNFVFVFCLQYYKWIRRCFPLPRFTEYVDCKAQLDWNADEETDRIKYSESFPTSWEGKLEKKNRLLLENLAVMD